MDKAETEAIRRRLGKERERVRARIRTAAIFPHGIRAAAHDMPSPTTVLSFDYDPDEDILFACVGKLRPAVVQDVGHGIHLRVDPHKFRPIGFEVLDFAKRPETISRIEEIFPGLPKAVIARKHVELEMSDDYAAEKLRELVPESWPTIFDARLY